MDYEPITPSYHDLTATCAACQTLAPFSQLFVCLKEDCGHSLQQKLPVLSPSLFYRREKVFCGACTFRGSHKAHRKYMQCAEPLAFITASGEMGTKLQMEFDKFLKTGEDTAVGYYMQEKMDLKNLPTPRIVEYLSKSRTIMEWHRRVAVLYNAIKTLTDFRAEGQKFVKEQAEELLTEFSKTSKQIHRILTITQPDMEQLREDRYETHLREMGIDPSTEDARSSFSSTSSTSTKAPKKKNG
ncbi:hypothetical protein CAEBREN_23249 [Caenorhabditis brenneri]|uniref:Uncharacterized protein n=1 Tax=Caenorhabditis brenneri TaxID=135651 RepID=G0NVI1_CAEBE|nr:hypothetical protein CAEBREN_23249 [Caenorhabditis brenneri]